VVGKDSENQPIIHALAAKDLNLDEATLAEIMKEPPTNAKKSEEEEEKKEEKPKKSLKDKFQEKREEEEDFDG